MDSRLARLVSVALSAMASACQIMGVDGGNPDRVADLRVESSVPGSLSLAWTQVDDGTGVAARYLIAFDTAGQISWSPLVVPTTEVAGTGIGQPIGFVLDNLIRGKTYTVQLVSYRGSSDSAAFFGTVSNSARGTVGVDAPGVVGDLQAVAISSSAVTASWTQVDNGAGGPMNYVAAIGQGGVSWSPVPGSAHFIAGSSPGLSRSTTFTGLQPSTSYTVQIAAVPGVFADSTSLVNLSNTAVATTSALASTAGIYFQDGFDSGSRTNGSSFAWSSTGSRVVVSSAVAHSGTHSLAFRFGPDSTGGDSNAEQRFTFRDNVTEVWIEYMLYVPTNYFHRNDAPGNNKFFRMWGDVYASANKVGASTLARGDGSSTLGFEYNYKTWGDGTLGFGPTGGTSTKVVFGDDSMRGKWTRIRMHYRMVSAANADDALMEMWIGDAKVITFANVGQKFDAVKPYWNQGYLMGWSNSGFTGETTFHIDDVKFFISNPGW